jgi:hypothetical protein
LWECEKFGCPFSGLSFLGRSLKMSHRQCDDKKEEEEEEEIECVKKEKKDSTNDNNEVE